MTVVTPAIGLAPLVTAMPEKLANGTNSLAVKLTVTVLAPPDTASGPRAIDDEPVLLDKMESAVIDGFVLS